ncbi:MAG TPA: hypothetical protein VGF52_06580 [Tepidisphaeraceae bacterium]
MIWDKQSIIASLRKLQRAQQPLSYARLAKRKQSLVSAAAYHFGSYRKALEKAGIDYADISQRPRWTRQRIILLIKQAKRNGHDLHWSAVTKRGDELSCAAFACLQRRLFGKWDRALHAAGLDADEIARYRTWDRNTVVFEIRAYAADGERLSSGWLQKDDPGLHAAAIRYFGNYDKALRAAHLDPNQHRQRRRWTKAEIIKAIKRLCGGKRRLSDAQVRRRHASMHGAAVRLFGSFPAAKKAAKVSTSKK